jgi:hypothetical protein
MSHHMVMQGVAAGAAALLLVASACVKDNTSPGGTPPAASGSFVGYSNPATKQTVCGGCHVAAQRGWVLTAHSWTATGPAAFQLLDNPNGVGNRDSAGFATECAWCHTTNGHNSGRAADSTGWFGSTGDAKKYFTDVQCEACHGPGASHVASPDQSQPRGTIASDTGLTYGCSVCHNEPDNPYGAEWRTGAHGTVLTDPAGRAACAGCHEGKTVVSRFQPSAGFAEQDSSTLYPITCVGCHDPHGVSGSFAAEVPSYDKVWLRAPIDVADVNVNLCMQCHEKRAVPDPTTSRGAHSPQGPMLLGTAGWQPPGFAPASRVGTHGTTSANPKLCVGCHMPAWDFTTPAGEPRHTPGHRFWAIPCMAADGVAPDTTNSCALASRNFGACSTGGCHGSPAVVQQAFQDLGARMQGYLDILWKDNNGNGKIDAGDTGLLTQVPSTEFKVDAVITVGEGALFNVTLTQMDRSLGAHNPAYAELLMISTINALRTQYGLPVPPAVAAQLAARARALGAGR